MRRRGDPSRINTLGHGGRNAQPAANGSGYIPHVLVLRELQRSTVGALNHIARAVQVLTV